MKSLYKVFNNVKDFHSERVKSRLMITLKVKHSAEQTQNRSDFFYRSRGGCLFFDLRILKVAIRLVNSCITFIENTAAVREACSM